MVMQEKENLENEMLIKTDIKKEVVENMFVHDEKSLKEMVTLGDLLKKAREEKGLDRTKIAQKLCIKEIYLQALEEGNYNIFPGLVYGAGFLRSYALFLELNEKETLCLFKKETSHLLQEPVDIPVPVNKNVLPSKKLLLTLFTIGIFAYLIWYILTPTKINGSDTSSFMGINDAVVEKQIKEAPITTDSLLIEATSETTKEKHQLLTDVKDFQNGEILPVVSGDNSVSSFHGEQVKTENFQIDSKKLKSEKVENENSLPLITGNVYGLKTPAILSFVATGKVWIEVREEEKVLFNKILLKGDGYNPPKDSQKMIMNVGNAMALSVYLNGEYWGTLDEKKAVKKNLSLDPASYSKN